MAKISERHPARLYRASVDPWQAGRQNVGTMAGIMRYNFRFTAIVSVLLAVAAMVQGVSGEWLYLGVAMVTVALEILTRRDDEHQFFSRESSRRGPADATDRRNAASRGPSRRIIGLISRNTQPLSRLGGSQVATSSGWSSILMTSSTPTLPMTSSSPRTRKRGSRGEIRSASRNGWHATAVQLSCRIRQAENRNDLLRALRDPSSGHPFFARFRELTPNDVESHRSCGFLVATRSSSAR